jgi:hypothetical protein
MFSFFSSRRDQSTVVVPGEHDFWLRLDRLKSDRSVFEAQGKTHGEIDLRLVDRIENLLVPVLGPWEQTFRWFHQMDYHFDGVRALMFRRDVLPRNLLPELQQLLVGEHEPFTILCTVTDQFESPLSETKGARADDYLALLSNKVLVTKGLADDLSTGA